jgi:peptidoglycan/LPS O-acetylase OafA/YrhL
VQHSARMGQLDALRAFAVCAVMLHHFYTTNFFSQHFPVGGTGLFLFFVLSGFLITGILRQGDPSSAFIGQFYRRRALRLMPIYYVVVIGLLAVSADVDRHWPCYVFQIMNFCVVTQSRWGPGGHFWSLAAEEQFYLLWPFAVLFLSRRTLIVICWMLIALAPVYRAIATSLTHDIYVNTMLTGVMDCLAAGALLALAPSAFPRQAMFLIGLIGCELAYLLFRFDVVSVADNALSPTLLLPFLCWLVAGASQGFKGALGSMLSNPALRYIGRISYGIYVIHYFTIRLLAPVLPAGTNPYLRSLALGALTIALASLSWHFLERPINRMRDRLPSMRWLGRTAATAEAPEISKPLGTETAPVTLEK